MSTFSTSPSDLLLQQPREKIYPHKPQGKPLGVKCNLRFEKPGNFLSMKFFSLYCSLLTSLLLLIVSNPQSPGLCPNGLLWFLVKLFFPLWGVLLLLWVWLNGFFSCLPSESSCVISGFFGLQLFIKCTDSNPTHLTPGLDRTVFLYPSKL